MKRLSEFNDKVAITITKGFGSMWAFYVLVVWMLGWMTLSGLDVWLFAHDKYPFQFLLFLSNLVQLWALPVIMVGQNVISNAQERNRDQHQEFMEQHTTHLEDMERRIMERLDIQNGKD